MLTLEQLKELNKQALRDRQSDIRQVLTTLIGEVEGELKRDAKAKEDAVIKRLVKKFITDAKTLLDARGDTKLEVEINYLSGLLPQTLSAEQINAILDEQQFADVKAVMQYFSKSGLEVDMKQVRDLFTSR